MPSARLLYRQTNEDSPLSTIVEKSQVQKPPFGEYDLRLNNCQLDVVLTSKPPPPPAVRPFAKSQQTDEGFESDIDSLSIISSDDSSTNEGASKTRETDSANGSSDSDTEPLTTTTTTVTQQPTIPKSFETHNLVDCVCYKDIKYPKVLVFVIKKEALVFQFDAVDNLDGFYTNFTTLKAVTNQKTYSKNLGAKFNLLHRTDNNGITHIEIAREPEAQIVIPDNRDSSIISISTPDSAAPQKSSTIVERRLKTIPRVGYNSYTLKPTTTSLLCGGGDSQRYNTLSYHNEPKSLPPSFALKSASTENLLELSEFPKQSRNFLTRPVDDTAALRKVWKSAEDLLDVAPKRPVRRKKPKGKAPPPPQNNVVQAQYVKVNVPIEVKPSFVPKLQTFAARTWNFLPQKTAPNGQTTPLSTKPQIQSYHQQSSLYFVQQPVVDSWTNSVPRLLRKPRSRSETRNFTPMAYRYIDTTTSPPPPPPHNAHTISNRLFGLSQKLKDFNGTSDCYGRESRRCGDYGFRLGGGENTLKSVIKKQDDKKSKGNDKKVTFSAYTTVQVV